MADGHGVFEQAEGEAEASGSGGPQLPSGDQQRTEQQVGSGEPGIESRAEGEMQVAHYENDRE